ncbi:hypothetical protein [Nocardia sp. NPDC004604]|uniref:hypothetical protein n=1 Tax=Nocardia sp. NPDC004604 TaxID=3157013 RepID=UPI0033A17218
MTFQAAWTTASIPARRSNSTNEVADIVLLTYGVASSAEVIERCLNVIDCLIENGAGGANLKADEATFDPNQTRG